MIERKSASTNDSEFDRRMKKIINELNDLYEDVMSLRDDEEEKEPLIEHITYLYKKAVLQIIERDLINGYGRHSEERDKRYERNGAHRENHRDNKISSS